MKRSFKLPLLAVIMALAIFATYQLVAPTTATATTTTTDSMTAALAPDIDIGTAAIEATIEKIARVDKAATTNATPVAVTKTATYIENPANQLTDGSPEDIAQLADATAYTDRTIVGARTNTLATLATNTVDALGPAHGPPTTSIEMAALTTAHRRNFKADAGGIHLGSDAANIFG